MSKYCKSPLLTLFLSFLMCSSSYAQSSTEKSHTKVDIDDLYSKVVRRYVDGRRSTEMNIGNLSSWLRYTAPRGFFTEDGSEYLNFYDFLAVKGYYKDIFALERHAKEPNYYNPGAPDLTVKAFVFNFGDKDKVIVYDQDYNDDRLSRARYRTTIAIKDYAADMISVMDRDRSGSVSLTEFRSWARSRI